MDFYTKTNCDYCHSPFPDYSEVYNHEKKCPDRIKRVSWINPNPLIDNTQQPPRTTTPKGTEFNVLNPDLITFGKYKDLTLSDLLKDRKYCSWLLKQPWFARQYEYLYNRIVEHTPKKYFVTLPHYVISVENKEDVEQFIEKYEYFHLCPLEELKISLSDQEKICYKYYLEMIQSLREKLHDNLYEENPYDIKAPSSWLNKFEKTYNIPRDVFKLFLTAYELPNIPYIIEDIKKMGGIEYKGAKSFLIAKENSLKQEEFWENILKLKYGDEIAVQYKYKNCFFDFVRIKSMTLYECKLNLKDFDLDQYNKYTITLGNYSLIYLISNDCIIDIPDGKIFTIDFTKYYSYLMSIKEPSKFDSLILTFDLVKLNSLEDYFKEKP